MLKLKYRYCKARMAAYLNGEMSLASRRRMARYIDECPDCYAEYRRQLDVTRELESSVGGLGRPDRPQLRRIWSNVQTNIQYEATSHQPAEHAPRRPARYGLVLLAFLVAVLLPWTLGNRNVPSIPSQPAPAATSFPSTPDRHQLRELAIEPTVVALVSPGTERRVPALFLQNTPAARLLDSQR